MPTILVVAPSSPLPENLFCSSCAVFCDTPLRFASTCTSSRCTRPAAQTSPPAQSTTLPSEAEPLISALALISSGKRLLQPQRQAYSSNFVLFTRSTANLRNATASACRLMSSPQAHLSASSIKFCHC